MSNQPHSPRRAHAQYRRDLKYYVAFFTAKLSIIALRCLGKKAGQFPGTIALKIDPAFAKKITQPSEIHIISGTNGKTTTNNLITSFLAALDPEKKVLSNLAGSNTVNGIISSFIQNTTLCGRAKTDFAVFELDELSFRTVLCDVYPRSILVTNLAIDSFSRNPFPEYIFSVMQRNLPHKADPNTPECTLILNADDLLSSTLGQDDFPRVFFSVDRLEQDSDKPEDTVLDLPVCHRCGGELTYEFCHYRSFGRLSCTQCGLRNPDAQYTITAVDPSTGEFSVREGTAHASSTTHYRMKRYSIINLYNMLAAISFCRELGYSADEIAAVSAGINLEETRYFERVSAHGTPYIRVLAKSENSAAVSATLRSVMKREGTKSFIFDTADRRADLEPGKVEDMSWNYITNYSQLNDESVKHIVLVGSNQHFLHVCMLAQGIDPRKIYCARDEIDAAQALALDVDTVFCIYDMYNTTYVNRMEQALFRRMDTDKYLSDVSGNLPTSAGPRTAPVQHQGSGYVVEVLFPEIANQNGDSGNVRYLQTCLPDAQWINTSLGDRPYFVDHHVDLVLLGAMREPHQLLAIQALLPYRDALIAHIRQRGIVLATGSAQEIFAQRIVGQDEDHPGLNLVPFEVINPMQHRYKAVVRAQRTAHDSSHHDQELQLLGCKKQFSRMVPAADSDAEFRDEYQAFCHNLTGFGRDPKDPTDSFEGFAAHGLLGCGFYGPFLVFNPDFCRDLLRMMGISHPQLAFEDEVYRAYVARKKVFDVPGAEFL